jgi:hypothetical protein
MVRKLYLFIFLFITAAGLQVVIAQAVPEMMWYRFDETGNNQTQNYAVPGVGSTMADVLGSLSMGGSGQFGAALVGSGVASSTDYVNTGWVTNLGSNSWTISLWLNNLPTGSTTLYYIFGDNTANSFRCFLNGIAGTNNIALRGGGLTDMYIGPVAPGPSVVHYVFDSATNTLTSYINGVLVSSVVQGTVNIVGAANFKICGYSTLVGLPAGGLMDEFRMYNRALDATEVAATWNDPLPVELTSFSASVSVNDVTLIWETASEINNSGFSVERKSTGEFEAIGFIPGFGTTAESKSYTFTDIDLQPGNYSYRLKQIDFDGSFAYSDIVEVEVTAPAEYSLSQNYPNPFNPATTISFNLAFDSKVNLKVFNVLGQEVARLLDSDLAAGSHTIQFDADNLNSGIYFYKLEAVGSDGTEYLDIKKMTLIK